ncbi:MAG: thiamine pyrophosphate-dependent dehydrogenase E1 component subunit alpha [Candidatus Promineifilaceae bacterium]|nr:thiamine pyrophosphate-dependent dehydrogenase E1 component subunit alpha [Candidatus Promineifilaceae bacterium]
MKMDMALDQLPRAAATGTAQPAAEDTLRHRFYYQMYLIRSVEQELLDLYAQGYIAGTVHTSLGQEACDVGVINALDVPHDIVFSNHRAHGQFITYTDDITGLIAEVMGKKSGVSHGVGGTQHLHKFNMYTNGVQGGIVPNAVGAAAAAKLKATGAIAVVFLGDGTMGQGTVYESFNIASLWSLPILFVLEDNGIAQTTPKHLVHAGNLASRADSFAINSQAIRADDVLKVYAFARAAVDAVRKNQVPFFLTLRTDRLGPHSKGDDTRPEEEIERYRQRDPLRKLGQELSDDERRAIELRVEKHVREAVEQAKNAEPAGFQEFREQWLVH